MSARNQPRTFVLLASVLSAATVGTGGCLFPSFDGFAGPIADATTDTPPRDAANPDVGDALAGDASTRCPANAIVCDGFEGPSPWTNIAVLAPDTLTVYATGEATVTPFRDAHALHVTAPAGTGDRTVALVKRVTPRTHGTMAIRAYVYLPRAVQNNTAVLELVDRASGSLDAYLALRIENGVWATQTKNSATSPSLHASTSTPALGRWTCVELDAVLAAQGRVTVFVDGASVLDSDDTTVSDPARDLFDGIEVGIPHTGGLTNDELFIDEVVAVVDDVSRPSSVPVIGCL